MVEGAPLLRAYGSKAHRGFESLPLRHRANQFSSVSITQSWQPRSGDSNPRYGKGGSTKSPQAILDDAQASPEGRGPKARVNPSLSARWPTRRGAGSGGFQFAIALEIEEPLGLHSYLVLPSKCDRSWFLTSVTNSVTALLSRSGRSSWILWSLCRAMMRRE